MPSHFRYSQYIQPNDFWFNCITDPDSLSTHNIPMITKDACMRWFGQTDSVYLMYSYGHYYEWQYSRSSNLTCHVFYNHPERSYIFKTIDTSGQVAHSIFLFKADKDTATSYLINIPIASSLQVRKRHHYYNSATGRLRMDSVEIKRVFVHTSGDLHHWNAAKVLPEKFCYPVPADSTFDAELHGYTDKVRSAPLPLHLERSIIRNLSRKGNNILNMSGSARNPDSLFYFQYLVSKTAETILYTIVNASTGRIVLVLSDERGNPLDAMVVNPEFRSLHDSWPIISARLGRDRNIHLVNMYEIRDTIGELYVTDTEILSTQRTFPPLTMPVSDFNSYFSYSNRKVFDENLKDTIFSNIPDSKQFPDSIFNCMQEMMQHNGGIFYGKNYGFRNLSNGLIYLFVVQTGNLDGYMSMYIVNQDNIMQNEYIILAGGGGDEGDYWSSTGYFVNDTSYLSFSKSCSYESHCDSTVTTYHIAATGEIKVDKNETLRFRVPYR